MIRLQELTVVLGRTVALDHVEAEIGPGITGVFGPNGAGKSTLLRVVAGLVKPSRGAALIDGRPISLGEESTRKRIGFAGHDSGLYSRLSLIENLRLFAKLYDVSEQRAEELVQRLTLSEHAATAVDRLSSGIKRRAAVARALLHDPEILLLDEPYANVDDEAADLVSQAVAAWFAPGRVALVATHGGKRLKAYADAGLILRHGRVVMHGRYKQERRAKTSS